MQLSIQTGEKFRDEQVQRLFSVLFLLGDIGLLVGALAALVSGIANDRQNQLVLRVIPLFLKFGNGR